MARKRRISGQVLRDGKEIDVSTIEKAIAHGIAYVTEDRKGAGLVLNDEVGKNTTLANLPAVAARGIVDRGREFVVDEKTPHALMIVPVPMGQPGAGHTHGG